MIYVELRPLVTLHIKSNADKYKNLLPKSYDTFGILQIAEHSLKVDNNGICNTILIDRDTPVKRSINPPTCLKASKTSSEDKTTL